MANGRTNTRRSKPKRKLNRGTIGVPSGNRGTRGRATITQAGQGLLQGSRKRGRNAIGVVPVGRKAISSGIRKGAKRSLSVNVVRRTEFAQRTGKIPKNVGSGEFQFPNLTGSKRKTGVRDDFNFGGRGVI